MRIRGTFRIKVEREGVVEHDESIRNTLTIRGCIELIRRLWPGGTAIAVAQGGPLNRSSSGGLEAVRLRAIKEASFVALDRLDHRDYYNAGGSLFEASTIDWVSETIDATQDALDWDGLPVMSSAHDSSHSASYGFSKVVSGDKEWRGLWVGYEQGTNQKINAVLASAVLASPVSISDGSLVTVSWTLDLDA